MFRIKSYREKVAAGSNWCKVRWLRMPCDGEHALLRPVSTGEGLLPRRFAHGAGLISHQEAGG